jgi:hypothetical protein
MLTNDSNSSFAGVIGLGAFKKEYKNTGGRRWISLAFGVLCLLATPVLLLAAAYLAYQAYNNAGLYRVWDAVALPLIFALIALFLGVLIAISAFRSWGLTAALFENGVAYQTRTGIQQANWADVTAVWQRVTRHYTNGVYTGTTHVYTVQTTTGQKIVLDDRLGKGVEELGNAVQRGASNALFPRYWTAIQNGQRVDFGALALDNQKLYAGKKELPWNEIKAVKINKGQISIKKDKGWFNWASVSVPQVPNFIIFYDLIGRFTKIE